MRTCSQKNIEENLRRTEAGGGFQLIQTRNVALQDPHCVEMWICGAISSHGLSYVVRGCSPPQGFFLCNDSFQPRNVL